MKNLKQFSQRGHRVTPAQLAVHRLTNEHIENLEREKNTLASQTDRKMLEVIKQNTYLEAQVARLGLEVKKSERLPDNRPASTCSGNREIMDGSDVGE